MPKQKFRWMTLFSLALVVAGHAGAQVVTTCPLGPTTEGGCEANCIASASSQGRCSEECTITKPSMYTIDGIPEKVQIRNVNGQFTTEELAGGTDVKLLTYYNEVYEDAIKSALKVGNKDLASKLEEEHKQLRESAVRYQTNINIIRLKVGARAWRGGFLGQEKFSGKIAVSVRAKYRCTAPPTPLLNEESKKSAKDMEPKKTDQKP